ncbi:MAG: DUF3394 domain-containing protein, partial [Alphaproteobacteria bacterium]|nr:DUF3394 domain-containing protein [Alphaproteobacteria bacterium]
KSRLWESVALVLIAFTFFRPGFWLNYVQPEYVTANPAEIVQIAEAQPAEAGLRIEVEGENVDGKIISKILVLPLGPKAEGAERLAKGGIEIIVDKGKVLIDNVLPDTAAADAKVDLDWQVKSINLPNERMPKEIFYIPAALLLILVWFLQRRRATQAVAAVA